MYFVYVLRSQKDEQLYTGFTDNLERRLKDHNNGFEPSTRSRRPFDLIYYESCVCKQDALSREKYLKSGIGKKFIQYRLKNFLLGSDKVRLRACPVSFT